MAGLGTAAGFRGAVMQLVDSVQTPQARAKGYIYYRSNPQIDVQRKWREIVAERKNEFNF